MRREPRRGLRLLPLICKKEIFRARLTESRAAFFVDMHTIADIVDAVASLYAEWRTLRDIKPEMRDGRPVYVTGNAAVSFRVWHDGRRKMLKCYTRPNERLGAIYGEQFHPRELTVRNIVGRASIIDCLLTDYIEGRTLDEALASAQTAEECQLLAQGFDRLAAEILSSGRAHGDLKPENIIVGEDGRQHAIDWDAAFVERFAGEKALEIGTAAYQHPERGVEMYDGHIDDYSIAMISTLLHMAAVDLAVVEHYRKYHEPPFLPRDIRRGAESFIDKAKEEFARRGWARQYRVAEMLRSPYARLFRLREVFTPKPATTSDTASTLDVEWGWWGCRQGDGWAIPPLYDSGFEPSEGVVLMVLGEYSHYVAVEDGRTLMSMGKGDDARSVRDGVARLRRADGGEQTIAVEELINSSK